MTKPYYISGNYLSFNDVWLLVTVKGKNRYPYLENVRAHAIGKPDFNIRYVNLVEFKTRLLVTNFSAN